MDQRYIVIDSPDLLTVDNTDSYLTAALEDIVANYPPRNRYPHEILQGLWSGPTGIAYLLLQVSSHRPDLVIAGQPAEQWARRYIMAPGSRGHNLRLGSHGCGVSDEKLAYEAVRSAVSKDLGHVRQFVSSVSQVLAVEEYPDENLYGRAGTLYLLRMVRHWVPGSNGLVDPAIAEISNTILNRGPHWKWHGRRYLGAVHGDIGIVTQLILTSPSLAPRLQPVLEKLLGMQLPDGNWPSSEESGGSGKGLVQFCHGAPGFVISLSALRSYFPDLHDRIDHGIRRGRECIWIQGLLKKEPNLCHGIFGNALALHHGPEREHFLAVATPENVARMKSSDPTGSVFERADYGRSYSTLTSYAPCAAWTWLVYQTKEPKILGYNDV
ncbi:Abscisic acid ABA receptor [Madurella fahalii]|uniref:Abscisic acid ABA receptor n=1 Tax=Madurella fahalii TaxID=1157608 RepID=A0ABQ0GQ17_9PEZI